MTVISLVAAYVEQNEGRRNKPYRDTANKLTIGVGFNLDDVGLLDNEIDFILANRLRLVEMNLKPLFPGYLELSFPQRKALIDLGYNLGIAKLTLFKQFIKAVNEKDWEGAARELLDSDYARQVPNRAARNAELIKDVSWSM